MRSLTVLPAIYFSGYSLNRSYVMARLLAVLGSICIATDAEPADRATIQISEVGSVAQSPDVAIGPDGVIHVVWLGANSAPPNAAQIAARGHSHDSSTNVYIAHSRDGGRSFSQPQRLNQADGDVWGFAISKPRIAAGPDGRVHVLFPGNTRNSVSGENETIALYVRSTGTTLAFDSPRRLNTDALDDALPKDDGGSFATLAVTADNTVYAAWIDTREIVGEEMGRAALAVSRNGGEQFERDRVILPAIVCPCCQLNSAVDSRRRLVLGARLVDGGFRDNEVLRFSAIDERLELRQRVSAARWALEGCPRKPTALAVRADDIAVAYYSGAEQPDGVYVVHSRDAGSFWSSPRQIHPGARASDAPAIIFSGNRLHLVWQARVDESGWRLFTSHSDDGGASFGTPVALPLDAGVARLPALAAHADGSIQIVWQQDSAIRTLRWNPPH